MTETAAYSPPRSLAAKVQRRVTQWRRARPMTLALDRPALSVCFDDFPASAAHTGAALLERYSGRGTFYAAQGLADAEGPSGRNHTAEDLRRLAAAGHEIGCHTFSHSDCARRDAYDTLLDLARNRDALAEAGINDVRALAYPYGETSVALKKTLPPRFISARGVTPGLNVGTVDLAHLRAFPLYDRTMPEAFDALARAAKRNAWMIAYTHDVADPASDYGVTPQAFDAFLAAARKAGVFIAPVTTILTSCVQWQKSRS